MLTTTHRVLIVDDEDDMRTLLRALLADPTGEVQVVAEAANGSEAVDRWRETGPDVVVLDQRMPVMTGLEAAAMILAERPEQAIVLFSAYLSESMRREAAEVGIQRCITKEQIFDLPDVIRSVEGA